MTIIIMLYVCTSTVDLLANEYYACMYTSVYKTHIYIHTERERESSPTSCSIEEYCCNKELPWIVIEFFLYQAYWGQGWLEVGVQQVPMPLHFESQLRHLTVFLAEVRALDELLPGLGWSFRGTLQR